MPHICFIENRGKTVFWQAVAARLRADKHQISWIVQNPVYKPKQAKMAGDRVYILPFPKPQTKHSTNNDDDGIPELAGDRGRLYFNAGRDHYGHYQAQITDILDTIKPDILIGEPTLFHELIAIHICKKLGIPYLHPTMNRYPGGRFSVFKGRSQIPAGYSHDTLDPKKERALARSVQQGTTLPDYMRTQTFAQKIIATARRINSLQMVIRGRLAGEKFNTPSVGRKLLLNRNLRKNLRRWQNLAKSPTGKSLLYPLQMQPECNIDVWGQPWSNQVETLKAMLAAAPKNVSVLVKANPKSKYEVSDALLALVEKTPRLVLLPLETSMSAAQNMSVGTLTVSGTVGLEAVFGKGRCLSLATPVLKSHFPKFHADTIKEAVAHLLNSSKDGVGNLQNGVALLQEFTAASFPGIVSEPLYNPKCMTPENIKNVASGIEKTILQTLS